MLTHEKSRKDKSGVRWNFCYWYAGTFAQSNQKAQRLFFWDDQRRDCGVVLFAPGKTVPYSRIKSLIEKLVADERLRKLHARELQFPLEAHYMTYPIFPEEMLA
jgi:hypothetical protein